MQLLDLSDDILIMVLRRSLHRGYDKVKVFESNLPLLSICQQWRALAIPMVYNHVYVQYGDRIQREPGMHRYDDDLKEPEVVTMKTNVDLIAAAGCVGMVTSAAIDVHCMFNPFPGLRKVVEAMSTAASMWGRVEALKISLHPEAFYSFRNSVNVEDYEADISEVASALAALMPKLHKLDLNGVNSNPFANMLFGQLAGHYTEQLQEIHSRHPIVVPSNCQFKCLKSVDISYDHQSDYRLPSMDTTELEKLILLNGPPNHSWASFSTSDDSNVIEFPKLEVLQIAYHAIYEEDGVAVPHRDGHPWELRFPSLKRASISCTKDICPLLEYMVLPPGMDSLAIDMKSAAYQSIAKLVLPEVKRLALRVSSRSSGDPSGLPAINRILEAARGSDELELAINDDKLPILPESITCTALTRLLVSGPTGVDTMLGFIRRLPNLTGLTFYQLELGDVQSDITVSEASGHTPIEPYDTKIKGLAVNYNREQHSPEQAVAVSKHLLLKIPTLTRFLAAQTPKQPVMEFAATFVQWYPHLDNVGFKLYEGEESASVRWCSQALL